MMFLLLRKVCAVPSGSKSKIERNIFIMRVNKFLTVIQRVAKSNCFVLLSMFLPLMQVEDAQCQSPCGGRRSTICGGLAVYSVHAIIAPG